MRVVIAYDVVDEKRLRKVYRFLCAHAVPLQKSVFLFEGREGQFLHCWNGLGRLIGQKDDVRAYPLPEIGQMSALGISALPSDVFYSGLMG